ncbi:MAG: uroporphyrinogen-III C-methyltransferase [Dokdonella sp.]
MSEDIESTSTSAATDAPMHTSETFPSEKRLADAPRGTGLAWLAALLALIIGAVALWRVVVIEHGQSATQASLRNELGARLDALTHGVEQHKHDIDTLRARLTDADGVNNSLREEVLGLGERARHLEDAVANLADQRLSGRDALALNETEFLLQQALERLALFHDAQAAIAAYTLADSALASAEDPVFASVRQSIDAERHALEASKPVETQGSIAAIELVRASLATLPGPQAAVAQQAAATSRWARFVAQFVHISQRSDVDPLGGRDIGLKRSLAAIDLNAAAAALLARDADGYKSSLARAHADIAGSFDTQSTAVKEALAELDHLASASLAPTVPELGNALKELRNLRATRALAQPAATKPAAAPPTNPTGAMSTTPEARP